MTQPALALENHELRMLEDAIDQDLKNWGAACRGESNPLGFPSKTEIYKAMMLGFSYKERESVDVAEDAIDTDRIVASLPEPLKRALYVEYVLGGKVEQRVKAYGKSQPTFYRLLGSAKREIRDAAIRKFNNESITAR